jgi:uncharacterized small protein (DUF1192 family)
MPLLYITQTVIYIYIYIYIYEVGSQAKFAGHFSPDSHLSLLGALALLRRGGIWRREWERLKAGETMANDP